MKPPSDTPAGKAGEKDRQQQERVVSAEEVDRQKDPHGIGKAYLGKDADTAGLPTSDREHTEKDPAPHPDTGADKIGC